MRTYTIALGLAGAVMIGISMSLITPSAWAVPTVTECFECSNGGGGECLPSEHIDSQGASLYQGGDQHPDCEPQSCDAKHTWYNEGFADPTINGPVDVRELQALVARVMRAVHDEDVAELADLTKEDARVRINLVRRAVQVDLSGNVIAHAALPEELVAKVLAHH